MQYSFFQKLSLFSCIVCISVSASAQYNLDTLKFDIVKDWQRAKAYTTEYLNTMPADKYSFRATDSVRSFAQQMLHLAQANTFFISNGTGVQKALSSGNLEQRASAQTKDSVVYYVNASYDHAIDAIQKMDAAKLGEKVKFRDFEFSRLTWINKAFEHQTHHRGQTTIYIRLAGVRPPNERLF